MVSAGEGKPADIPSLAKAMWCGLESSGLKNAIALDGVKNFIGILQ